MEQLLSTEELADYLGVTVATLYEWRTKGKGPRAVRVGRNLKFRPADVDRWLDQQADGSREASA